MVIVCIAAALCALYLLLLRGHAGRAGMEVLRSYYYAHRGLHGNGIPENSMAAFRRALEHGYGIELDIHLMKDGSLAVIHDSSLQRTANQNVDIEDLTKEDLPSCFLQGTTETIPLFSDVMALFEGKAPMIVELKPRGDNYAELTQAAVKIMENYNGPYCMESFDPRCIKWLHDHAPHIIRGQLACNFMKGSSAISPVLRFALTHNLLNFATVPDFIAYEFGARKATPNNALCRKIWGIQGVSWTIRSLEDFHTAVDEGWIPIFESFIP